MTRGMRILRHLLADARAVRRVLPATAMARIGQAIAAGEARHDGEVRFCVEAGLPWSYLRRGARARERAIMLFSKLRVWDTERNTGVLLYVLLADRAIEVVADRGIARAVPQAQWDAVCADMSAAFRAGRAEEGVLAALERVHGLLAAHFPPQAGNPNELADAPVVL
ncbi:MAG: TPM domain-containing protein [Burkholderiales bacterium]|nr:TPM domain-containing protein [Burkholderiales bacterium]